MKVVVKLTFLRSESKKSNKTGNVYHLANFLTDKYENLELNVSDVMLAEKLKACEPMTPLNVDLDITSGRFGINVLVMGFSVAK